MRITLPFLPERSEKPRESGLTMMMDKGLSTGEVRNFVEMNAPYTDLVKLGFGTSVVSAHVEEKIRIYAEAGIHTYLEEPFLKHLRSVAWLMNMLTC